MGRIASLRRAWSDCSTAACGLGWLFGLVLLWLGGAGLVTPVFGSNGGGGGGDGGGGNREFSRLATLQPSGATQRLGQDGSAAPAPSVPGFDFDESAAVIQFRELKLNHDWRVRHARFAAHEDSAGSNGASDWPKSSTPRLDELRHLIPMVPDLLPITASESLFINPKIPQLAGIWTTKDVFDPPQYLLIPEFGGHVIATYASANAVASDPLHRRAQSLGIAPDWNGSGLSLSGSFGNLLSNGRNVGLMNFGLSLDQDEGLKSFAPFIGFSSSVAVSYDSDPPSTIQPTNILVRTMIGLISHFELDSGEWLQLRLAFARDINGTKPYDAYFPRFRIDQSRSNGFLIDLDAGLDLSTIILGGAVNPHISFDTLGSIGTTENRRKSSQSYTINIRWRL